jgi:hypothetical protein
MSKINLEKVLTISGKQGLFKILSQTRQGVIAQSLLDQKKIATHLGQQINVLSEIRIFGIKEEVPLEDVFEWMYKLEDGQAAHISAKAPAEELESYFFEVFQDYDEDRVYASDIKKIIQWYNILLDAGLLSFHASKEKTAKDSGKK